MLCLYLGFCLMCGVSCSTSSTSTNDLSQPSIVSNDSSLPSSVAARLTCNSDADTCSELGHRYGNTIQFKTYCYVDNTFSHGYHACRDICEGYNAADRIAQEECDYKCPCEL